eukprot:COSAG05_NODE_882_length_6789_cov_6.646487_6_plen_218_part_00
MVQYSVEAAVFEKVPGYRRLVLLAKGVANPPDNGALNLSLTDRITATSEDKDRTVANPKIEAWWAAYKAVGIKVKSKDKVQPGVAALLRRIAKGQGDKIPFISCLVALGNFIALEYMCPTGAFDVAKLKGPLVLGPCTGNETFTAIANKKTEPATEGVVALKDEGAGLLVCDKWNSKGGLETAISPEVTEVGIDIDMIVGAVASLSSCSIRHAPRSV